MPLEAAEIHVRLHRLFMGVERDTAGIDLILSVLKQGEQLGEQYEVFSYNTPESWQYSSIAWIKRSRNERWKDMPVFQRRVDRYPDSFMASSLNMMRATRIMLLGEIKRMRASGLQDYTGLCLRFAHVAAYSRGYHRQYSVISGISPLKQA
jgi:hypothetical protein